MSITRIPAKDPVRAFAFYAGLLGSDASNRVRFNSPFDCPVTVMLQVSRDLDEVLEFVWASGGSILNPEPLVEGDQCRVAIADSEGNHVLLVTSVGADRVRRSA
jgi:predicted enzyme related to lactoylglutathione lyase